MRQPGVGDPRAMEAEGGESGQSLQMRQPSVGHERPAQIHDLDLAELPDAEQVRSRSPLGKVDMSHVAEVIGAHTIDQPSWRKGLSPRETSSVLTFPVVQDIATSLANRCYRITLDSGAASDPAEPAASHQD